MLLKLKATSGLPFRMDASTSLLSPVPSLTAWHCAGRTGATLVCSTHVYFRMPGHSGVLPLRQEDTLGLRDVNNPRIQGHEHL